MKKIITVALLLLTVSLLGCIGTQNDEKTSLKSTNEWCKTGTIIQSVGPLGNITNFEVKGITTHNGLQLCEADYDSNGTLVQYFNENKSYNTMVIKSANGTTMEINVNRVLENKG